MFVGKVLFFAGMAIGTQGQSGPLLFVAYAVSIGVVLIYFVFISVAVWRCANKYLAGEQSMRICATLLPY